MTEQDRKFFAHPKVQEIWTFMKFLALFGVVFGIAAVVFGA